MLLLADHLILFFFGWTGIGVASQLLSSFSHRERVGDLAGMSSQSPTRATLLTLFLLSTAGFPGTMGFVPRRDILKAVEHAGHRVWLLAGVFAVYGLVLLFLGMGPLFRERAISGRLEGWIAAGVSGSRG